VLSELRDRLRAGDVWVIGSRRYRSFEERLISRETQQELQQSGTLPIAVDADFERFIAGRRALLDERLAAVELKAKGGFAAGRHTRQRRAEGHADREIDGAGSRGLGRSPLRDAAADPRHRPAIRGGGLDAVHRLLHPSAKRRDGCRPARPDGGPPGRRAQSRPDAHGGSLHDRQPRTARLGGRLAHTRRDLRPGAAASRRLPSASRWP
jgi:hypothetical protein